MYIKFIKALNKSSRKERCLKYQQCDGQSWYDKSRDSPSRWFAGGVGSGEGGAAGGGGGGRRGGGRGGGGGRRAQHLREARRHLVARVPRHDAAPEHTLATVSHSTRYGKVKSGGGGEETHTGL
ncbi:unnamed protein product, partial [Brenthis ino]